MENRAPERSLIDTGSAIIYRHDNCDRCPLPLVHTSPLSSGERRILDSTGDIYVTLVRADDGSGLWDMDVQVYERGCEPGAQPVVTHLLTVGVAKYTPPGVPPWLWTVYSHLAEMCVHFMDEHDDTTDEDVVEHYVRHGSNVAGPASLQFPPGESPLPA